MKEYYRAFFVCDGYPENTITVDLAIDENRRWVEHLATAGWWGRLNSDDIWPFILQKGGRMDLGNDFNDPSTASQRYAWIELSDCIIARGDRYSVRYDGADDFILDRLTKFSDLLS